MVEVRLTNFSLEFKSRQRVLPVLCDVSLRVESGEYVVILGPSGCGKTSLLRSLAGTIQDIEADVRMSGTAEVRTGTGTPLSTVTMAPQTPCLLPWRTVMSNTLLPFELLKGGATGDDRQRASALLRMLGIEQFENDYPHQLSGGIAQRASLARALIVDAELLLLDEPLGSVDLIERERLQLELRKIAKMRRRTVLQVTHDFYSAAIADRVIVFSDRPARIAGEVKIPQNKNSDLKETSEFMNIISELRELMRAGDRLSTTNEPGTE